MLEKINAFIEARDLLKECGVYGFGGNYLQLNHTDIERFAEKNDLAVDYIPRTNSDYPFEAQVQLEGVRLIGVLSKREAEERGLLNTCPICGHKKEANADTLAIAK